MAPPPQQNPPQNGNPDLASTRPCRRRVLRFGLRTMFLLVTLCACLLGRFAAWKAERQDFLASKGVTDWTVAYAKRPVIRPAPPWQLWLVGDRGVRTLVVPENNAALAEAKRLFPEAEVIQSSFVSGAIVGR